MQQGTKHSEGTHQCDMCHPEDMYRADWYCPDCKKSFCHACNGRAHHPYTVHELHSVEEIVHDQKAGVKILTPIIDEIIVFLLLGFTWYNTPQEVKAHYQKGVGILCPITQEFDLLFSRADTGMRYAMKSVVSNYCQSETAFWELFLDAWIRGIVTDTDSILILLSTTVRSWVFSATFMLVCVPFVSIIQGVLVFAFQHVEALIPREWEWAVAMERWAERLNTSPDIPMKTKFRTRGKIDFVDDIKYTVSFHLRLIVLFVSSAGETMRHVLKRLLGVCIGLRAFLIVSNLGWMVRALLLFVPYLGNTILLHEQYFGTVSGSGVDFSDNLFWSAVRKVISLVPIVGPAAQEVASRDESTAGAAALSYFLLLVALVVGGLNLRKSQQKAFAAEWEKEGRTKAVGKCRGNPCGCVSAPPTNKYTCTKFVR